MNCTVWHVRSPPQCVIELQEGSTKETTVRTCPQEHRVKNIGPSSTTSTTSTTSSSTTSTSSSTTSTTSSTSIRRVTLLEGPCS